MDQELKEQWVSALRSGDYLQGRRTLAFVRDDGTYYCCLGVLCKIYHDMHPEQLLSNVSPGGSTSFVFQDEVDSACPPGKFSNHVGLSSIGITHLINMNDISMKSFAEIADWIEENL